MASLAAVANSKSFITIQYVAINASSISSLN